jgi:hypothetical protein
VSRAGLAVRILILAFLAHLTPSVAAEAVQVFQAGVVVRPLAQVIPMAVYLVQVITVLLEIVLLRGRAELPVALLVAMLGPAAVVAAVVVAAL